MHTLAARGDLCGLREALLEADTVVNATDGPHAETALHAASRAPDSTGECCKVLLAAGADPGIRCARGSTCLHQAAHRLNACAIEATLQHRPGAAAQALVNVQDDSGRTALHISAACEAIGEQATQVDRASVIAKLLLAGADMTLTTSAGQTALELALAVGCMDGADAIMRLGSVLSSSSEGRRDERHADLPRRWMQWKALSGGHTASSTSTSARRVSLNLDSNLVADAYKWVPTFEQGHAESAILEQALEALTLPSAEALGDALSLAEGEHMQAICERIARHELQRYEAATASGHPEPALSAFRFYQLMFPPPPELSAAKRALAASKAWKAADAGGVHKQWCELLEAADRERFEREQLGA